MNATSPASAALGKAVRDAAEKLNAAEHFDASELLRVLARIVEGRSIDKAFGAPGDWGYGTAIGDALFKLLKEPQPPKPDTIVWHYVADGDLPDEGGRCLLAFASEDSDELEFGHYADRDWADDAHRVLANIYAWAHAPAKPPQKGPAS